MPLSEVPFSVVPSLPSRKVAAVTCNCLPPKTYGGNFSTRKVAAAFSVSRNLKFVANSASRDDNDAAASVEFDDVSIPSDYSELLEQARKATDLALKDNKQLMEIEFPTSGLESVPGDGEGGIEMTESMQLIREFCNRLINPEKATRTRIFFPEASEVKFARESVFEGASFKLDYLTKPSFFEDFGFVEKVKMKDRVKPEDELFLAAYPYFNVNEMLVVEELYKEAVENTSRNLIIFNGELDRIRSGYYPPFFYPKLAALSQTLFPVMETVYYIHNFKGRNGGTLFRCYPGPWKVFRKVRNRYVCLHQQEAMPSLKEVALDILPSS
ncbi:protein LOW PSII ACCUMULATION 3, chloroplastic [Prunus avium]|uniref:Protein LOW PSII ACCUMULATION 3, chloroplastic n=1 Tax=Prunus avium TaxID=42229 RepID=A0A6P5U1E3_PRUAV|nr:protein LOW PSII ACCUMULATION 3, chloroplastic [Prunus avium]